MPRIPNHFTDCSFFVYRTAQEARDGMQFGGSGFLVHVPSTHPGIVHVYAVTNKHLVDNGYRILRLNTADGHADVVESEPESWFLHPEGDDLAILPMSLEGSKFKWWSLGTYAFATRENIDAFRMGLGDEVFMIGRLVTIEGRQKNTPVIRFGNLSMMADPANRISAENGHEQEGFLVECRSLSGFSGSAVFVMTEQFYQNEAAERVTKADLAIQQGKERDYRKPERKTQEQPEATASTVQVKITGAQGRFGPLLLGIDCMHIPLWKPIYEKGKYRPDERQPSANYEVESNTGIACVVPAWKILDVLNQKELVRERQVDDEKIAYRTGDGTILE